MLGKTASKEAVKRISSAISKWKNTASTARNFYSQSQQDTAFADRLSKTALSTEREGIFSAPAKARNFSSLATLPELSASLPKTDTIDFSSTAKRGFSTSNEEVTTKTDTPKEKSKEATVETSTPSKESSEPSSNFEILSRDDFRDIALDKGGKKQIGRIAGRYITYVGEDKEQIQGGDTFLGKIPGIANDGVDLASNVATGGMVIHSIDDHVPNNLLGRAEVAVASLLKGIFEQNESGIIIPETFLVHKETGQKYKKDSDEYRDGYFENGGISEFVASKIVDLEPAPEDIGPGYIYWMQDKMAETNYSPLTDMFATFAAVGGLDSMGPNFTNCGFKKDSGEFVALDFGVALGEGLESSERFSANGYLRTCDKTRGIFDGKADSSNASDVAWGSLDGYFDKFSSAEMAQILYRRYVNVDEFMKSNDIFASADPAIIEDTFDKLAEPSPIKFDDAEKQE